MTPWLFLLAAAGMGCCALAQHWWHKRVLQSEHRYRQSIERAPIGIAVVGDDGYLRSANPAFWQMMGSPPAQQIDILKQGQDGAFVGEGSQMATKVDALA